MVSVFGGGMSFEERNVEDEGGGGDELYMEEDEVMSNGSSSVFHDPRDNNVLISSTNEIAMFADNIPRFKKIHTLWLSAFMILLALGMFVMSVVLPYKCDKGHWALEDDKKSSICVMKPISLLAYMHCVLWAIFLICRQIVEYQHAKIRRRGYLDFYIEMRTISQLPFWIVSGCSVLLLTITTVLRDHCKTDSDCAKSIHLTKTEYLTACIGLETVALTGVICFYMYQIWRFNKSKVPPDVFREDTMTCALDYSSPRSIDLIQEEIFHRQADLIKYFKDRNVILQRTVLEMNNQLAAATRPPLHTSVDL